MYYYTPKKSILRDMQSKKGSHVDAAYFKRMEILKLYGMPQDHLMTSVLRLYFPGVKFYSRKAVREVPVNGFMFPVEMFDEVKE